MGIVNNNEQQIRSKPLMYSFKIISVFQRPRSENKPQINVVADYLKIWKNFFWIVFELREVVRELLYPAEILSTKTIGLHNCIEKTFCGKCFIIVRSPIWEDGRNNPKCSTDMERQHIMKSLLLFRLSSWIGWWEHFRRMRTSQNMYNEILD